MKKILLTVLSLVIIMSYTTICINAEDEIKIIIDGNLIESDIQPVKINDHIMVPLRAVFETLGADVYWDDAIQTASAAKDGLMIALTIDVPQIYVNGDNIRVKWKQN